MKREGFVSRAEPPWPSGTSRWAAAHRLKGPRPINPTVRLTASNQVANAAKTAADGSIAADANTAAGAVGAAGAAGTNPAAQPIHRRAKALR
jgi:hypothetical protein